jgi:hypothetical protein
VAKVGLEWEPNSRNAGSARARGYLRESRSARGVPSRALAWLRFPGALALLAMAALHLQQAIGAHYSGIPTIGTLFFLNFAGGTLVGLGLMSPAGRIAGRRAATSSTLLALAGIGLAAASIAFLLISESTPIFGFRESGYQTPMVVALASEGAAVLLLSGYLAARGGRGTA